MSAYPTSIFIATGCVFLATAASATDLRVVESNDDVEVSIDVDRVKAVGDSVTEVYMLEIFNGDKTLPGIPIFRVISSIARFRCYDRTVTVSQAVFLDGAGTVLANFTYPVAWTQVDEAETDLAVVSKYICGREW